MIKPSIDKVLLKGKLFSKNGDFDKARNLYQSILNTYPNNIRVKEALKSLQVTTALKHKTLPKNQLNSLLNLYNHGKLQSTLNQVVVFIELYPHDFILWNLLGIVEAQIGKIYNSEKAFKKVIEINPRFIDGYINLGNILKNQSKINEALLVYKKALEHLDNVLENNLNYSRVLLNIGVILHEQNKLDDAAESYRKVISIEPENIIAHNNLGVTLKNQGKLEEALLYFKTALKIKPDYVDAYYNMGTVLQKKNKFEEAVECYKKVIFITPNYSDAFFNMGIAFIKIKKFEKAKYSFNKVISFRPDYAEAYKNLGWIFYEQGKLEDSINFFKKSILLKTDYIESWYNIFFPLQAIKHKSTLLENFLQKLYGRKLSQSENLQKNILNFKLKKSQGIFKKNFNELLNIFAQSEKIYIDNPKFNNNAKQIEPESPKKIIALTHFGRSGTGLLHSLIDHHPEISTLPSIYFSEFFDKSTWAKITANGWDLMVDSFINIYEILFNSNSTVPIEIIGKKLFDNVGSKEGTNCVGDKKNEYLSIDKVLFSQEMKTLMKSYKKIDALTFFKLVHLAYEKVLNNLNKKNIIFYHIHNPDTYSLLNFLHLAPNANFILMVREPIQSCESWLIEPFNNNNHSDCCLRIATMLCEVDNVIYQNQESKGVRLEDLKNNPKKTIPVLCQWLGIKEKEILYEMTTQGKKWWGDPSSPDYSNDGMLPFGKTSINRKVGMFLSENDQLILRTLFYPFSLKFDYATESTDQFKNNLQKIRPLLEKPFDFERKIIERTNVDQDIITKSGPYIFLRSVLVDRWNLLNKFKTYPNMIERLHIN